MNLKNEKTYVIAEIGSNHNGELGIGKVMIEEAKKAGCDAVKFQLFKSETMYAPNTPDFAGYKDVPALIKSLELSHEHAVKYQNYCEQIGIDFLVTPFCEESLKFLVELGVPSLKIAGFEASDPRFVDMCAASGLPLIISIGNGMNVRDAIILEDRLAHKLKCRDFVFLHCNNAYPTPIEDSCLDTIIEMKRSLKYAKIGFSDHTEQTVTPAFAVMNGAVVIEKHFTLDKKMPGPDHNFAVIPRQLREMVQLIRLAEKTKKNKPFGGTKSESAFKSACRSVVLKKDVAVGEELTENNITTRRPYVQGSIKASLFYDMLGKTAKKSLSEDQILMEDSTE